MIDFDIHTHNPAAPPGRAIVCLPMEALLQPDSQTFAEGQLYSAGIHPCWEGDRERAWQGLLQLVGDNRLVAVGECGLDKLGPVPMEEQELWFSRQMELASRHRLPLIVHCVRAWDRLLAIHRAIPATAERIAHGFRGKPMLARQLTEAGWMLSFGPRHNPDSLLACPDGKRWTESD